MDGWSRLPSTRMPSRPGEFHPEPLDRSGLDTLASSVRPVFHGIARPVAPTSYPREQQNVALPLVIPLGMVMLDIFAQGPPPNRTTLDKHSFFTYLTQRSAYAFRFGLRAGNTSGST